MTGMVDRFVPFAMPLLMPSRFIPRLDRKNLLWMLQAETSDPCSRGSNEKLKTQNEIWDFLIASAIDDVIVFKSNYVVIQLNNK